MGEKHRCSRCSFRRCLCAFDVARLSFRPVACFFPLPQVDGGRVTAATENVSAEEKLQAALFAAHSNPLLMVLLVVLLLMVLLVARERPRVAGEVAIFSQVASRG